MNAICIMLFVIAAAVAVAALVMLVSMAKNYNPDNSKGD